MSSTIKVAAMQNFKPETNKLNENKRCQVSGKYSD
jgi:hypothetical protein